MNNKNIKTEIIVNNQKIGVMRVNNEDYISLTDLAKYQKASDPSFIVKNWLRKINTINYVGLWEKLKLNMAEILSQFLLHNGLEEQIL